MVFVRPSYNAEASYLIWLFGSSFLLFNYVNERFIRYSVYSLIAIFILLSIWGLTQYTTGFAYLIDMGHRANAIFITPNTFAASINIILMPTIVVYLIGSKNSRTIYFSLLILFAALLVTQSRGGWVAFICSILFICILIKLLNLKIDSIKIKNLLAGLAIVFFAYSMINVTESHKNNNSINEDINYLIRSDSIASTMSHRLKLYDIAWQQIKQKPLIGSGLHTYQFYKTRDLKPPYVGGVTRFSHNDYLQLWMETGVFGIVLFIMLFIIPVYLLVTLSDKVSAEDRKIMLAIISGLASFYVHALVDFVFYVPFLLLMFACGLGLFNQKVNKYYPSTRIINLSSRFIRFNILRTLAGVLVIAVLSQPAIAQLAYTKAVRKVQQLNIEAALPLFELARRFVPYEPDYYWYEGAVLMNAVKKNQHQLSATRADELFSKGMAVSAFSANNRLARAELHRDYSYLLAEAEDLNVVLSWNEDALYWKPNDPVIRAEYLKTLIAKGEYDKASSLLISYILQNPESENLIEIKERLQKMDKALL